MKLLFNDHTLRSINRIALPIVVAMSLSTAVLPFLHSTSQQHPEIDTSPFYDLYHLGALFGLHSDGKGHSMKKIMRDIFTPVSHRLNAVYNDGSDAFIAINDGATSTFVDHGSLYKNLYRVVSISSQSAVLSAYGKKMTLHLGEEGKLSLKETVTAYVPDENAEVSSFIISRVMIDRYTKNMGEAWKNITLNEVVERGKTIGFKVVKIANDTPFALLGLQKGDVITSIDNKPLNSYASAFAAYQAGLRRFAIKITIIRNNQPKDLEYEISR
jgi:type II secretory pathway component PulC